MCGIAVQPVFSNFSAHCDLIVKSGDDDLRVWPGRVYSGGHKTVSFLNQALKAAGKAGGRSRRSGGRSAFGRGRAASLPAAHGLGSRARSMAVKAHVVRRMRTPGALAAHLRYLGRDGVTKDGAPGPARQGSSAARKSCASLAFACNVRDERSLIAPAAPNTSTGVWPARPLSTRMLQTLRNVFRAAPCRFFASACFEHSSDCSVRCACATFGLGFPPVLAVSAAESGLVLTTDSTGRGPDLAGLA